MEALLVINAGSSSLKFQIFGIATAGLERQVRAKLDGIATQPRLKATAADGTELINRRLDATAVPDLPEALSVARDWLATLRGFDLRAIGHRVVHGGPDYVRPVLIETTVLDRLASYQDLAPLHQPNNLAPIRLAMDIKPDVPQVACFDTAFHRGRAEHTDCYALPRTFYEQGVRRYGFHGISYEYIAGRLREVAPEVARGRVIVAHLGSGASMCALKDGRSVETTMGFTALDGLPMGTRPGQLDPGVVLHLLTDQGMSAQAVSDLLYHRSGLKGLSGISNDMRGFWRAMTRALPSRSTISCIAARSMPACWPQPWAASTLSSLPPVSAKTPRRSGPVFPKVSPGSARSSIRPQTMQAPRSSRRQGAVSRSTSCPPTRN